MAKIEIKDVSGKKVGTTDLANPATSREWAVRYLLALAIAASAGTFWGPGPSTARGVYSTDMTRPVSASTAPETNSPWELSPSPPIS